MALFYWENIMESRLFKKLKRATPLFHWQRHEDKFTSGIPDCSYAGPNGEGWVELKTYDNWPREPSEALKFTDLKPTQVNWAMKRIKAGGTVWFLVEVGNDWFLIDGKHSRNFGSMPKWQLLARSELHGTGPIPRKIQEIL